MTPEHVPPEDQRLLIGRARIKAFRFPKGKSGNPGGLSKFYFAARQLAKQASPDMMQVLIDLAKDENADQRVRSVCAVAVLDRGGVRPVDFDPNEDKQQRPKFNPADYSPEELDAIEAVFKLMVEREKEKRQAAAAGPEILPPDTGDDES